MKSWDTELSAEDTIGTKNLHVFKDRRLSMNRYLLQIIKYITSTSALRVLSLSGQKPGYFWKKNQACSSCSYPLPEQLCRVPLGVNVPATWANQYSSSYRSKPGNRLSKPRTKTSTNTIPTEDVECLLPFHQQNSSHSPCSNFSEALAYFYVVQSFVFEIQS